MTMAEIRALKAVLAGGCERRCGARGNTMHGAPSVLLHKLAAEGLIRDGATWPTPRRRVSSLILTNKGQAALEATAQRDRIDAPSHIPESDEAWLKVLIETFERAEDRRAKIDRQNTTCKRKRLGREQALKRANERQCATLEARERERRTLHNTGGEQHTALPSEEPDGYLNEMPADAQVCTASAEQKRLAREAAKLLLIANQSHNPNLQT